SGKVKAVEYQGYFVKVMLNAGGSEDFVAYVSERKFFNNPVTIGDNVLASWPVDHARILAHDH
ncbi:MAG: TOBE domain-containing protein, partial [Xanthobacteraceae bacterium]